jgi:hypothetical protein
VPPLGTECAGDGSHGALDCAAVRQALPQNQQGSMIRPVFGTLISDAVIGLCESVRCLEGDHFPRHDVSRAQRTAERRQFYINPFLFRVLHWATVLFTLLGVSAPKSSWDRWVGGT